MRQSGTSSMSPWIMALLATMQVMPLRSKVCPSTVMVKRSTAGFGFARAAAK